MPPVFCRYAVLLTDLLQISGPPLEPVYHGPDGGFGLVSQKTSSPLRASGRGCGAAGRDTGPNVKGGVKTYQRGGAKLYH